METTFSGTVIVEEPDPGMWGRLVRHVTAARALAVAGGALIAVGLLLRPGGADANVVDAAYAIPDGGGYCKLSESGVPADITHGGTRILPRSKGGTYCSGFTFAVAMKVAGQRGLLADLTPHQVKRFQREWYGATPESRLKQVVTAMENLKVGREVYLTDARPGDFVVFSTTRRTGHSVVFLDWVRKDGQIIGLRYRSSQSSTGGVGDRTEYFTTSGLWEATIIPKYTFVGRLDS